MNPARVATAVPGLLRRLPRIADALFNLGTRPGDDVQRVRLVRQLNALNLFYASVAFSITLIFLLVIRNPVVLTIIQAAATLLFVSAIVITAAGRLELASHLTIIVFELHLFLIMVFTRGWYSPALSMIILYPLLAALLELSIGGHLAVSIVQAALLFATHLWLPGVEKYFVSITNISLVARETLNVIRATYIPIMAATIIGIIFKENVRARAKQKEMLTRINQYNQRLEFFSNELKDETRRLRAEFDIARKIQIMVLPSPEEIRLIDDLDISCFMLPAAEVGGDYYDVIKCGDTVTIGIGDVAGHGLSSGLIMLMAQTAIRTLAEQQVSGTPEMLPVLNRTLLANIRRLKEDRSITLLVITYRNNRYRITGQHESIVLCRHNGAIEVIDTADLGFYMGLVEEMPQTVKSRELVLDQGDLLFLYSDGVTDAVNERQEQFGLERVCAAVKKHHRLSADNIKNRFVKDLLVYIGNRPISDDISLVVVKQKQPI